MINIAVCDDEILYIRQITELLQEIAHEYRLQVNIDIFNDGIKLENNINSGISRYDLMYLDIEMPEDGITLAKKIRLIDKTVLIVYITSHDNYMKESFAVRPFRYLGKPIDRLEFTKCFKDSYKEILEYDYYFRYRYDRMERKLLVQDILYFMSKLRKVYIVTSEETYEMYSKLDGIEEEMQKGRIPFLRIHRSYLVNFKHIDEISYDYIIVSNGKRLSVSEERKRDISEQYCLLGNKENG